jgi:hypothetical protein
LRKIHPWGKYVPRKFVPGKFVPRKFVIFIHTLYSNSTRPGKTLDMQEIITTPHVPGSGISSLFLNKFSGSKVSGRIMAKHRRKV